MNLIVDIGNNCAKFFLFNNGQIVLHARKEKEYSAILRRWSELYDIERAIVSAVVDIPCEERACFDETDFPVIWFDSLTPLPIGIKYRTPQTLGCDRIAAAVGAVCEAPGRNILVIDAGTAVTTDFIDREGNFCGGNIAPGIKMRLTSLHMQTGRLPLVKKEGETPLLGFDTETAIRSGTIRGLCHEIDGYIDEMREKYGDVLVFLTGGDEKTLIDKIKNRIFADKFLVAKGLNRILTYYDKK